MVILTMADGKLRYICQGCGASVPASDDMKQELDEACMCQLINDEEDEKSHDTSD